MSPAQVLPDSLWLTSVDLDVDVTADVPCSDEGCDRPARWRFVVSCPSRHTWLLCDEHLRGALWLARRVALERRGRLSCRRCDAEGVDSRLPHPPGTWSRL